MSRPQKVGLDFGGEFGLSSLIASHTAPMLSSLHSLIVDDSAVNSSAVFVYDSTPSAPFGGHLTKATANAAEVWQMQTRPGAGSALVGFVNSIAFTSKGAAVHAEEDAAEEDKVSLPAKRSAGSSAAPAKKVKTVDTGAINANKPITVLGSTASFLSLVPSLLSLPSSNLRPALAVHVSAQTSSLRHDAAGSEVSRLVRPRHRLRSELTPKFRRN